MTTAFGAIWAGVHGFAMRFAAQSRGNVAMIFGLSLPALILMTVGGVDLHRASTVRVNLQDALDAAALAAARSQETTPTEVQRVGLAALRANLKAYPEITLREDQTKFVLNEDSIVIADSKVDVKAIVANIFLPPYGKFMDDKLPVGAHSEVNRSSKNLEVALVLDITGSMDEGRIEALQEAALNLVDIVVQENQSPFYSKMSIVPYSMGVNVDSYAATARGAAVMPKAISDITWFRGSHRSVTNVTRENGAVVTAANHGFATGDTVTIWGASRMTGLNGKAFTVGATNTNAFRLVGVDSRDWNSWSGTATVAKCARTDCNPTVTASGHGLANDDYVYIDGVGGMTQLNKRVFRVENVSGATYTIDTVGARDYTSGGISACGKYGCQWRIFTNADGNLTAYEASACVSERTGGQAYTDAYVSSARVSFNYPQPSNPCPTSTLLPLTSAKGTLRSKISGLTIGGSTAGHIGTAWGWYTVAPTFNSLWPSSSAGAYGDKNLLKAVILMTDGEFNTPYCSGVVAKDALTGSGSDATHINCNATNGDAFAQALALCRAMKAKDILVYTVGFQVAAGGAAETLLGQCASGAEFAHTATTGDDLDEAFKAIGRDITELRISR